ISCRLPWRRAAPLPRRSFFEGRHQPPQGTRLFEPPDHHRRRSLRHARGRPFGDGDISAHGNLAHSGNYAPIAARPLPPEANALSEAVARRLTVTVSLCSGMRLSPKTLRHEREPLRSPRALGAVIIARHGKARPGYAIIGSARRNRRNPLRPASR